MDFRLRGNDGESYKKVNGSQFQTKGRGTIICFAHWDERRKKRGGEWECRGMGIGVLLFSLKEKTQ